MVRPFILGEKMHLTGILDNNLVTHLFAVVHAVRVDVEGSNASMHVRVSESISVLCDINSLLRPHASCLGSLRSREKAGWDWLIWFYGSCIIWAEALRKVVEFCIRCESPFPHLRGLVGLLLSLPRRDFTAFEWRHGCRTVERPCESLENRRPLQLPNVLCHCTLSRRSPLPTLSLRRDTNNCECLLGSISGVGSTLSRPLT